MIVANDILESGLNLVEATITDLLGVLGSGCITSVELVAKYLERIGKYDANNLLLNSVCVINPQVFDEAQASDDYRASGKPPRPLEGIPFTVKDSFKVKGMTVAAGSPTFADLMASSDAAIVESLRKAGAIVLGRTNMPPMADGGAHRGIYGCAQSAYNMEYSCTAYVSGSSNGAATSTTASFAAFGFGGETVSSGRSPASNNALVAYSPSRGVISNRGQWPLYSTCDVVVPLTRSVSDQLHILNAIVHDDDCVSGDFWRQQNTVSIPKASQLRPKDYHQLASKTSLCGKRIGVPRCYIGMTSNGMEPSYISDSVLALFQEARLDLESLGASVVETSFPLLENYTKQLYPGQSANVPGMAAAWIDTERYQMIALVWDDFLKENGDTSCSSLGSVDGNLLHPHTAPMDDPIRYTEAQNQIRYVDMVEFARSRSPSLTPYNLPGCQEALRALEAARKRDLEEWMDREGLDLLVFPTAGDVCRADSEEVYESMLFGLKDGVKYANGGRALKHLGVPAISLPMGNTMDKNMPAGITFVGKGYSDNELLAYAFAYEQATQRRIPPPLTPPLPTDALDNSSCLDSNHPKSGPRLTVDSCLSMDEYDSNGLHYSRIQLQGTIACDAKQDSIASFTVSLNGETSGPVSIKDTTWSWSGRCPIKVLNEKYPNPGKTPKDYNMVLLLVKTCDGRAAGSVLLL